MLISHAFVHGVLHMALPSDLDVTDRAAAVLETEALVHAHRPRLVQMRLAGPDPSASLSALARARRLCSRPRYPPHRRRPHDSASRRLRRAQDRMNT